MAARNVSCRECGEPQKSRGLCQHHYDKIRRSGQLERVQPTRRDPAKRDKWGRKHCIGCNKHWPEASFSKNASRKDGLAAYCKLCIKASWSDKDRDRKYGLEIGSVQKMYRDQDFRCAICRAAIDSSAHVDHDHDCCPTKGKACGSCVREILCKPCNLLLGYAGDSIDTLMAAAEYLKKWGK